MSISPGINTNVKKKCNLKQIKQIVFFYRFPNMGKIISSVSSQDSAYLWKHEGVFGLCKYFIYDLGSGYRGVFNFVKILWVYDLYIYIYIFTYHLGTFCTCYRLIKILIHSKKTKRWCFLSVYYVPGIIPSYLHWVI